MASSGKSRRARSMSATDAQNNFGEVLARVARDGRVFITRYHRTEAVLLSMKEYEALIGEEPVDLKALERDFDTMVARMQSAEHRTATEALFRMSGADLGRAVSHAPKTT